MAHQREKPSRKGRLAQKEAYTLSDLDQIKVLADPLRIRILESFCEERTTKQVAELLGEKPTKLYHHVDALERVGLIRLSRTRRNRGTLEKYYLAVARTFLADSRIFQAADERAGGEEGEALQQMLSTIFDTTSAELAEIIRRGDLAKAIEDEGVLSFVEIRASPKDIDEIRSKLNELVQSLVTRSEGVSEGEESELGDDAQRYRLTLAYYPLGDVTRDR